MAAGTAISGLGAGDGALTGYAKSLRRKQRALLVFLALALFGAVIASLGLGAVTIGASDTLKSMVSPFLADGVVDVGKREETVLQGIRMPRTLFGILAGAALALAGATLQGLFRNPLADPSLIGVSMGAALGAVTAIVLGGVLAEMLPSSLRVFFLPLAAFAAGLLTTVVVYKIADSGGQTDVPTLLLAGIAMNAIASAGIGFLIFLSDDQQLRDLSFWMLGSLGGVTWARMLPIVPFVLLALVLLPLTARYLDAMTLGEREAGHLGFSVEKAKRAIVVLVALGTGATVALTGVIGFIGLVVPHLIRLLAGPGHGVLLPASMLLGATLMLLADLGARLLVLPAELPIGILTSCIGGPFFIWLLLRRRRFGNGM